MGSVYKEKCSFSLSACPNRRSKETAIAVLDAIVVQGNQEELATACRNSVKDRSKGPSRRPPSAVVAILQPCRTSRPPQAATDAALADKNTSRLRLSCVTLRNVTLSPSRGITLWRDTNDGRGSTCVPLQSRVAATGTLHPGKRRCG